MSIAGLGVNATGRITCNLHHQVLKIDDQSFSWMVNNVSRRTEHGKRLETIERNFLSLKAIAYSSKQFRPLISWKALEINITIIQRLVVESTRNHRVQSPPPPHFFLNSIVK